MILLCNKKSYMDNSTFQKFMNSVQLWEVERKYDQQFQVAFEAIKKLLEQLSIKETILRF